MSLLKLHGKTIVVGICGSIAAYKSVSIVKKLGQLGALVQVIMTGSARELVDPREFAKVSGHLVHTSLFDEAYDYRAYLAKNKPIAHISLADIADLILVCPATANILAKVASGIADDLLSSTILATNAPVIFCPAMNVKMWRNPITQENVAKLKRIGYHFVDPQYGDLACGYKGVGRLAKNEPIIEIVTSILHLRSRWRGKKVVVTAGATGEPLDRVRVVTNRATGKMGAAVADVAFLRGAEVVLIRGKTAVLPRYFLKEVTVETGVEMLAAVAKEIDNTDIVIHTAAVTDFYCKKPLVGKVKSDREWQLSLSPTAKIIEQIKKLAPHVFLVGFKAEYKVSPRQLINRAWELLKESAADLMVANDIGRPGRGFAVDTNEVYIVDKAKNVTHLPLSSKTKIAEQLLDLVRQRFA